MIRRPPRSTRTDTLFPTRRSSDLGAQPLACVLALDLHDPGADKAEVEVTATRGLRQNVDQEDGRQQAHHLVRRDVGAGGKAAARRALGVPVGEEGRSEEHTSELQSLMRISYAVFGLKKKKKNKNKKRTKRRKK